MFDVVSYNPFAGVQVDTYDIFCILDCIRAVVFCVAEDTGASVSASDLFVRSPIDWDSGN